MLVVANAGHYSSHRRPRHRCRPGVRGHRPGDDDDVAPGALRSARGPDPPRLAQRRSSSRTCTGSSPTRTPSSQLPPAWASRSSRTVPRPMGPLAGGAAPERSPRSAASASTRRRTSVRSVTAAHWSPTMRRWRRVSRSLRQYGWGDKYHVDMRRWPQQPAGRDPGGRAQRQAAAPRAVERGASSDRVHLSRGAWWHAAGAASVGRRGLRGSSLRRASRGSRPVQGPPRGLWHRHRGPLPGPRPPPARVRRRQPMRPICRRPMRHAPASCRSPATPDSSERRRCASSRRSLASSRRRGGDAMLSLIIPVYRNEESVPDLLEAVEQIGAALPDELEAVFVVDGSPTVPMSRSAKGCRRDPIAHGWRSCPGTSERSRPCARGCSSRAETASRSWRPTSRNPLS